MTPLLFGLFLWLQPADAEQLGWACNLPTGAYEARWRTSNAAPAQEVKTTFATTALFDVESQIVRFQRLLVQKDIAALAKQKAAAMGIRLKVKVTRKQVSYRYPGGSGSEVKQAIQDATHEVLASRHFIETADDGILLDHVWFAVNHAPDVAPLAQSLAAISPDSSPRSLAETALAFVQTIPYKAGGRQNVLLPLGVLSRNEGDCDAKSLLYLSLLRTLLPTTRAIMVYVPGHAFVGLDLPDEKKDATVKWEGTRWVLAEPVGPAVVPVGEIADTSRKAVKRNPFIREVGTEP